jgi:hypothetical protein
VLACVVLVALALLAAGCGAKARTNDPRPPAPVRVSVTINDHAVTVAPAIVAVGPDRSQQIPQNQVPQPNIRTNAPLTLTFVAANLTDFDSHLVINGPRDVSSGPMVANGNGTLQTALPTGIYRISAADIPSAAAARFVVGPFRPSSKNDLLLP